MTGKAIAKLAPEGADIAVEIGRQYRRGIEHWIEAGRLLRIQQDALDHGQWLPWLEENREKLGFGSERTAQRLMRASRLVESNTTLTSHLNLWGNDEKRYYRKGGYVEWYTPEEYIELARKVLGEIDLDPGLV